MRMWMVDPKTMCRRHLLGEHCEIHMIVGSILKKKQLDGFVDKNCLEFRSIGPRHEALVAEMLRRKYKHNSFLPEFVEFEATEKVVYSRVDRRASLIELRRRCPECRKLGLIFANICQEES